MAAFISANANFSLFASLLLFLLLTTTNPVTTEAKISAVYFFGDEWLDIGSTHYIPNTGFNASFRFPYGSNFPTSKGGKAIGNGRFSDGKLISDYLCENLGIPSPPPYLKVRKNMIYAQGGVNFASAGSGALATTNNKKGAFDLGRQVEQFQTFVKAKQAIGRGLVKGRYQNNTELFSDAMAVIHAGTNDYISYLVSNSNYDSKAFVNAVTDNIVEAIRNIRAISGIKKFVVFGMGPVGCVPAVRFAKGEHFCSSPGNSMANVHTGLMDKYLATLRKEWGLPYLSLVKQFNLFYKALSNPGSAGFRNGKDVCCARVMEATKRRIPCGRLVPGIPKSKNVRVGACPTPGSYVWWDDYHTTGAFNRVLTNYVWVGNTAFMNPYNVQKMNSELE